MDEYRKKVDGIRAPEALKEKTLLRIRQEAQKPSEEGKQEPVKHRRLVWMPVAVAAAAACLVLVIGLTGRKPPETGLTYYTVSQSVLRAMPEGETSVTAEQYSDYLGTDLEELVQDGQLIKTQISMQQEGQTVIAEQCAAYYDVQGKTVMLQLSKTTDLMPEELQEAPVSKIGDQSVRVGVSEDGKQYMAAFRCKGIHCFVLTRSMDKGLFEQLLTGLIRTLENSGTAS